MRRKTIHCLDPKIGKLEYEVTTTDLRRLVGLQAETKRDYTVENPGAKQQQNKIGSIQFGCRGQT